MILRKIRRFAFKRCLGVAFLVALLSVTASAYTLVMRDGRRLSIPDDFVVSNATLTYVAGDRIQVTVQLVAIDIAATERANNEAAGSFVKRAQVSRVSLIPEVQRNSSQRSVTNDDLQRFRVARLANEAEYERRRKELGLPSIEEARRQAVVQTELTAEAVRDIRVREYESESYWRARASDLRAELAATNARIDFVRARLNELPTNPILGVVGGFPFTTVGLTTFRSGPRVARRPNVFRAPGSLLPQTGVNRHSMGSQIGGRLHFGGNRTRAQVIFNATQFGGFRNAGAFFPLFPSTVLTVPFQDYSYERSALISQLDELLSHRAGLQARWRDLEEEARRAGAYPGWLRP